MKKEFKPSKINGEFETKINYKSKDKSTKNWRIKHTGLNAVLILFVGLIAITGIYLVSGINQEVPSTPVVDKLSNQLNVLAGNDTSKNKLSYKECTVCESNGIVICPYCKGNGEQKVKVKCDTCNGTGKNNGIDCDKCVKGIKLENLPCEACKGTGEIKCTVCEGEGKIIV